MHRPSTRKMSDKHEEDLKELFPNSSVMPGSGSGWAKQMDVRGKHTEDEYAFAVDGKSTFGESIGVSLSMWDKAVEQSHNEIPVLAFRWYSSYQLDVKLDLICVEKETFRALLQMADENEELRNQLDLFTQERDANKEWYE